MKPALKVFFLALPIIVFLLAGCSETSNPVESVEPVEQQLMGIWDLEYVEGISDSDSITIVKTPVFVYETTLYIELTSDRRYILVYIETNAPKVERGVWYLRTKTLIVMTRDGAAASEYIPIYVENNLAFAEINVNVAGLLDKPKKFIFKKRE